MFGKEVRHKCRLTKYEKKIAQKKQEAESIQNLTNPLNIYNPNAKSESPSMTPNALVSADVQQLDEEVKAMMDSTENVTTIGSTRKRVWTCKVCGKDGQWANIKTHIEANHITSNVSHSCDICGKISRSRDGLRKHKAKVHST